jgi:hypothetical protein
MRIAADNETQFDEQPSKGFIDSGKTELSLAVRARCLDAENALATLIIVMTCARRFHFRCQNRRSKVGEHPAIMKCKLIASLWFSVSRVAL